MQATKYLLPFALAAVMLMHHGQCLPTTYEDPYLKQLNEFIMEFSRTMDRSKLSDLAWGVEWGLGHVPKDYLRKTLEEIANDPKIVNVKTDKMEKYRTELKTLASIYVSDPAVTTLLCNFEDYVRSKGLNVNSDEIETGETGIVVNELKKRIMEPMEKRISENFDIMMDMMAKTVEQYLNSLSAAQLKREERMEQWVKRFKAETDKEKKVEMLDTFKGLI